MHISHPFIHIFSHILWHLYTKINCHQVMATASPGSSKLPPSCPATFKKSVFNASICSPMCRHVKILDLVSHQPFCLSLCEQSRLQEQVYHVIRRGLNNWCLAAAISCETVLSEDSVVLESRAWWWLNICYCFTHIIFHLWEFWCTV